MSKRFGSRVKGVFEPSSLRACLDELQRRGVPYGPLRPLIVTDSSGAKQTLFTNVTLLSLPDTTLPTDAAMHNLSQRVQPGLRGCRRPLCPNRFPRKRIASKNSSSVSPHSHARRHSFVRKLLAARSGSGCGARAITGVRDQDAICGVKRLVQGQVAAGSFMRAASSGQRGCRRKGSTMEALAYTRANGSRCSIMRPYQSAAASRSDVSRW